MTDKDRILMVIVSRIIPGIMYSGFRERDEYVKSFMLSPCGLQHGDLVFANTSLSPNDFMVGFVEQVDNNRGCVVIREIGSERICDYFNESFSVINKEKLGYEILEGLQYKTYQKVLKAFSKYGDYNTRFKSISFDGNKCTVQSRKMFSNDVCNEWSFVYDSKTSIKSIGKLINPVSPV
jgi:hypothetical protein